jgi:hypothetical protein
MLPSGGAIAKASRLSSAAMFDPQSNLLFKLLATVSEELAADPSGGAAWAKAEAALAPSRALEPELATIVDAKDVAALRAKVAGWADPKALLPEPDRQLLKRALTAFKKSLKVTRLDEESHVGRGPMSGGRKSGIVGIAPPNRFPQEVWDELVRQGRLVDARHGIYELKPEGTA